VDYLEFRRLRQGCISNLPPANIAVLDAAASTLRRRLTSNALFADVTIETSSDPERLLVGLVHYRPGAPTPQVSSHLEAVWVTELRLPGLDAYNFHTDGGHVELESFTGDKSSGYFLTMHLVAEEGSPEQFTDTASTKQADEPKEKGARRWFRR
jgi:hypothetical protein